MAKDIDKMRVPFAGEKQFAFSGARRPETEGATDDLEQRIMDMVNDMLSSFREEIEGLINDNPPDGPDTPEIPGNPPVRPPWRWPPPDVTRPPYTTPTTQTTSTTTTTTTQTTSTTTTHTTTTYTTTSTSTPTTTSQTTPEHYCCNTPVFRGDAGETFEFLCFEFSIAGCDLDVEYTCTYEFSYMEADTFVYVLTDENCPVE